MSEKLTDAEIAARAGFGEPAINPDESEEDNSPEGNEEETQASESPEEGDESTEQSDDSPEAEEDDSDDDSEPEEGEDEEDEEDSDDDGERTVSDKSPREVKPKKLHYRLKAVEDTLKGLEGLDEKITNAVTNAVKGISEKEGNEEETKSESEKAAEELADELGLDSIGLAKILEKASELAGKGKMSPELEKRLQQLDSFEKEQKEKQAQQKFNEEWNDFVPEVKKKYPNADDNVLSQAKELMDELAHSKEFHKIKDLDYILYKNKGKFDTVLNVAPKSKSGEKSKKIGKDSYSEEGENLVDIDKMTPELMKKREAESLEIRENQDDDIEIIEPL